MDYHRPMGSPQSGNVWSRPKIPLPSPTAHACFRSSYAFQCDTMKNFLPYLGALALGASFVIAPNDKATAQTPSTPVLGREITEIHFATPLDFAGLPKKAIVADDNTRIELRGSEFAVSVKGLERYHVPMTAVGRYKIAGEE